MYNETVLVKYKDCHIPIEFVKPYPDVEIRMMQLISRSDKAYPENVFESCETLEKEGLVIIKGEMWTYIDEPLPKKRSGKK